MLEATGTRRCGRSVTRVEEKSVMKLRRPAEYLAGTALLALVALSVPAGHVHAMSTGQSTGSGTALCTMFTGTGPNDLIIVREEGETYTDEDGNTWKCTHWGDWLMVPMVSSQTLLPGPVRPLPVRASLGS
jgi:hypothetical protein